MIVSVLRKAAEVTFPSDSGNKTEEHKGIKRKRKQLIKDRKAILMEAWKNPEQVSTPKAMVFHVWLLRAQLTKLDRKCRAQAKAANKSQQKAFLEELDSHVRSGNEAQAQQVARAYARTQRISIRAMRSFPHARLSMDSVCKKHMSPANEGGWNADHFEHDKLNHFDLSFRDRDFEQPLKQKKAAAIFRKEFRKNIMKAPNRKSTQPGEIRAELLAHCLDPDLAATELQFSMGY